MMKPVLNIAWIRQVGCLYLIAMMTGCAASLHVSATRIGTAPPDPGTAAAKESAREAIIGYYETSLSMLSDARTIVQESFKGLADTSLLDSELDSLRKELEKLRDVDYQYGIAELGEAKERADALLKSATKPQQETQLRLFSIKGDDPKNAEKLIDTEAEIAKAVSDERGELCKYALQFSRAKDRLMYGGFRSSSMFLINPGDESWEKAVQMEQKFGKNQLVFSQVRALASDKSTLMVVQESPAHFEPRYVRSDPTQSIRNALTIVNWVLEIAATYVPTVSMPEPLAEDNDADDNKEGSTSKPVEASKAQTRLKSFERELQDVLSDPAFASILKALDENTDLNEELANILTDKQISTLRSSYEQIRRLYRLSKSR